MSVSWVAGQDIASTIRILLEDTDSDNYEFSDANLENLLARAMERYFRFVPYYKEYDVTTVVDQQKYALPSDCVRVVEAEWRPYPGISTDSVIAYYNMLYGTAEILPNKTWNDGAANTLRDKYASRFDKIGAGTWAQTDYVTSYSSTQYLTLYPIPASAETFTVRYTCKHPLTSSGYFTVSPEHVEIVQKLLLAECYGVRLARLASMANTIRVGTTDSRFDLRGLAQMRSELYQEVQDVLGAPIVGYAR